MPDGPGFHAEYNPRDAALNARARVEAFAESQPVPEDRRDAGMIAETVSAVVHALVYVGDQVRALAAQNEPVDAEVVDQAKVEYADALRRIVDHEEHMGSGPPDDEMRAIARKALEGVEDA